MTSNVFQNSGFKIEYRENHIIANDSKSGYRYYLSKTTFEHLKESLKDSPYGLRDRRLLDYSDFVFDGSGRQIKMRSTVDMLIEYWYSVK